MLLPQNDSPAARYSEQATAEFPESLEAILELLRIESTSSLPNQGIVDHICRRLEDLGLFPFRVSSQDQAKSSVFVSIPDLRRKVDGGVLLSGHIDTVGVQGQNWHSNPFEPYVAEGRLHGRGTADMKSFCGSVLASLQKFLAKPLNQPLHIAFTYDEETGCGGAKQLAEVLKDRGVSPSTAIIGEPTLMKPIVGHKGCARYDLLFEGLSGHSSLTPYGVNAVEYAARAVAHIRTIADRLAAEGPLDQSFNVPFTTISTGRFDGGSEPNIIPDRCTVQLEIRAVPGQAVQALEAEINDYLAGLQTAMQAVHPASAVTATKVVDVPALDPGKAGSAFDLVARLTGTAANRDCVSYGTEAGIFQNLGMDAVLCGPGDIAQAHIANEFISLDQISLCDNFLELLAQEMQTP